MRRLATAVALALLASCGAPGDDEASSDPVLLTKELPFVYPTALYEAGVEGDVALRLFIDSLGLVVPDSTTVAEPSGHVEFDSAAIAGAPYLEFQPARQDGSRIGKVVVLPVKFRKSPGATDSLRADTLRTKR